MEVILRDDIAGLGDIGERVKVKGGYARNYLIPRSLAFEVGTKNGKQMAHHLRQLEAKRAKLKGSAENLAQQLRDLELELVLRVGEGGRLFGSVNARDVSMALKAKGIEIDRRRIVISEPIKKLGMHLLGVKLHAEVNCQVKVNIVGHDATEAEKTEQALAMKRQIESKTANRSEGMEDNSLGDLDDLDPPQA